MSNDRVRPGRVLHGPERERSIAQHVRWYATREPQLAAVSDGAPIVAWLRRHGSRDGKSRRGSQRTKGQL